MVIKCEEMKKLHCLYFVATLIGQSVDTTNEEDMPLLDGHTFCDQRKEDEVVGTWFAFIYYIVKLFSEAVLEE